MSNKTCKEVNERVRDRSEDLSATSVIDLTATSLSAEARIAEARRDATARRDVEVTRDNVVESE
jgi:hypothetical protein